MHLSPARLILKEDGAIYHLNLLPEDIAGTILLVGDPARVSQVSQHFDHVKLKKVNREFVTHTGQYQGMPITVMSTGMGCGNIDIAINELDALVNINLSTREPHAERRCLRLIRLGTAGALHDDVALDSIVLSESAIGLDNNIHFYEGAEAEGVIFSQSLGKDLGCPPGVLPYVVSASSDLAALWHAHATSGVTLTLPGFYASQGRHLCTKGRGAYDLATLAACRYQAQPILNLEMETAPLYALGCLLGHHCLSLSVILAQRAQGVFSSAPKRAVDRMIKLSLEVLRADHAASS